MDKNMRVCTLTHIVLLYLSGFLMTSKLMTLNDHVWLFCDKICLGFDKLNDDNDNDI